VLQPLQRIVSAARRGGKSVADLGEAPEHSQDLIKRFETSFVVVSNAIAPM